MKAAVYEQYGGPEQLEVREVDKPAPRDNEVLVRVVASTVCRTDCGFLRAQPFIVRVFAGLRRPKNTILGCEFSGTVVAVGNSVSKFNVGDRVFGFKDDDHGFACHAQFTKIPESAMIAHIPENIEFEHAGGLSQGGFHSTRRAFRCGV